MTFDYINTLFKVPPGYLKTDLSITDPSVSRLSLSGYAKNQGTSTDDALGERELSVCTGIAATTTAHPPSIALS